MKDLNLCAFIEKIFIFFPKKKTFRYWKSMAGGILAYLSTYLHHYVNMRHNYVHMQYSLCHTVTLLSRMLT